MYLGGRLCAARQSLIVIEPQGEVLHAQTINLLKFILLLQTLEVITFDTASQVALMPTSLVQMNISAQWLCRSHVRRANEKKNEA